MKKFFASELSCAVCSDEVPFFLTDDVRRKYLLIKGELRESGHVGIAFSEGVGSTSSFTLRTRCWGRT